MKQITIILIIAFSFANQSLIAQDTLTFLNGKAIYGLVMEVDSFMVTYQISKNKKTKTKSVSTELLFDIKYQDGKIDTLYSTNPHIGNYLTPLQMHHFILGEQDASEYYRSRLTAIIGVAFGVSFGYLLHDGFWVASVPLVYSVGAGITKVKIKNIANRDIAILRTAAYQEGYIKVARSKKAFSALVGSLVGTVIGIGVGYATD